MIYDFLPSLYFCPCLHGILKHVHSNTYLAFWSDKLKVKIINDCLGNRKRQLSTVSISPIYLLYTCVGVSYFSSNASQAVEWKSSILITYNQIEWCCHGHGHSHNKLYHRMLNLDLDMEKRFGTVLFQVWDWWGPTNLLGDIFLSVVKLLSKWNRV